MNAVPVDTSTVFHTTKTGQKFPFAHLPGCECDTCEDIREVQPHYHVVEFINGCLNDYDSGPYESLEDARSDIKDYVQGANEAARYEGRSEYIMSNQDRYVCDIHILKIEECTEEDCFDDL